jgi:UDP-N-acetylmuramate dehydrogenase
MLVAETVSRGLSGLENLSDIPGVVGASPVQNIGAYGVEVKDVIESVEVLDMRTRGLRTLAPEECAFGYRDSIFKHDEGKPFIVTNVSFSLSPVFHPNIAYKDLTEYFATRAAPSSSREVRDAVCTVRAAKFPDLSVLGTAGSFFKNPVLSTEVKEALAAKYPDIPSFPAAPGWYKVPLAWILDHVLHVNGFRSGNVSLFEKQPLVLVAHTGATAREIDDFARDIEKKVFDATHIEIEREVQSVS